MEILNLTQREVIETYPEPYRSQALKNSDKELLESKVLRMCSETIKQAALSEAFEWVETPEGFEYWCAFYESLSDWELIEEDDDNTN